jgi:cytosine/adenosine deaminase-related metal-dependent hydrolase
MRSAAACFDDLQLLKALTSNGARALGLQEDCGSLVKNKNTGLNHIKINKEAYQFIKKVA